MFVATLHLRAAVLQVVDDKQVLKKFALTLSERGQ